MITTTTAVATIEPAEPPDLKSSRTPAPQIEEARKALKKLGWGAKFTLDKFEAKKALGRFMCEGGLHPVLVSTGFETIGQLDAAIATAKAISLRVKGQDPVDRTNALAAEAALCKVKLDALDKVAKWSKEVDRGTPLAAPTLQQNEGPSLGSVNVQVNIDRERDDDDAIALAKAGDKE